MPQLTLKLVGYIAAVIAALWAVWFVYDLLTAGDKVKARLGENQTDAAIESGKDAVNTTGDQSTKETERDNSTKDMQNEVNKTDNPSDAHAVGAGWLCNDFGICPEE